MTDNDKSWLTGQLLLAMPMMGDPRFHRAVIYMCLHDEKGAMGIMINHAVPAIDFGQVITQLKLDTPVEIPAHLEHLPVMTGGPVESARGFILHTTDFEEPDSIRINDDFSVTGTIDALKVIANGKGPEKMVFALGYAGWDAGQLDQEIQQNAWLTAPATHELVFATPHADLWNRTIAGLGIDPCLLSTDAGRA